ncbi:MAG: hypothetical protein ABWY35_05100 [Pseudorhodoplanes sp.]
MMSRPLFAPTARQTNWLIAIGLVSLGYAMYLRYQAIELTSVGLTCQSGLQTWLCSMRSWVTTLFENSVFGWVAIAIAILNLIRPHLFLFSIALAAAAFGVVLHNAVLAGLAAGLLIMSLARPRAVAEEE